MLKKLDYVSSFIISFLKEWQFTGSLKLKCRIKLDKQPLIVDVGQDEDDIFKDYMLRRFLRFNIQIYKEPILSG